MPFKLHPPPPPPSPQVPSGTHCVHVMGTRIEIHSHHVQIWKRVHCIQPLIKKAIFTICQNQDPLLSCVGLKVDTNTVRKNTVRKKTQHKYYQEKSEKSHGRIIISCALNVFARNVFFKNHSTQSRRRSHQYNWIGFYTMITNVHTAKYSYCKVFILQSVHTAKYS